MLNVVTEGVIMQNVVLECAVVASVVVLLLSKQ